VDRFPDPGPGRHDRGLQKIKGNHGLQL
jgi:hypothetical protein